MATVTGDEDVADALSQAAERAARRGAYASAATAFERAAALTLDPAKLAKRLGAAARAAWTAGMRTGQLLSPGIAAGMGISLGGVLLAARSQNTSSVVDVRSPGSTAATQHPDRA